MPDPFTHLMAGTLIAKSGLRQHYGWVALMTLMISATFPDIDVLYRPDSSWKALLHHRGITHSLFGALILSFLIGGVIYFFAPLKRFWLLVGLSALGLCTHIFLDLCTSWGTQIFAPFSSKRYGWGLISIIDRYVLLILLVSVFLSLRGGKRSATYSKLGLVIFGVYLLLALFANRSAYRKIAADLGKEGIKSIRITPYPSNFGPITRWYGVAEGEKAFYYFPRVSIFSQNNDKHQTYPKIGSNRYIERALEDESGKLFRWFADYLFIDYRVAEKGKHIVEFWDLRFGGPGRRRSPFHLTLTFDDKGHLLDTSTSRF
jgi:inner membrane protein